MIDVVEVFRNARPCLARAGIEPDKAGSDPRAAPLFEAVRHANVEAFPGTPTPVRIAARAVDPDAELQIVRADVEQLDGIDDLRLVTEQASHKSTSIEA